MAESLLSSSSSDILLKCTCWTLHYSTHGSPWLSMTLRWFWYMERVDTDDLPKGLSTRTTLRSVFDMVYLNLSLPESSLVWSGHPVTLSFVPIAKSDTFVSFFGLLFCNKVSPCGKVILELGVIFLFQSPEC